MNGIKIVSAKGDILYYIYYGILTLMMATWTSTTAVPPIYLRLPFLIALFYPLLFTERRSWLPAVLILFMGMLSNGFALTYLPIIDAFYYAVIIIAYAHNIQKNHLKPQPVFLILIFYTFFVNIFNVGATETMYLPLFLIFMFAFFIPNDQIDKQRLLISYSIIIVSLVESLLFLTMGSQFVSEVTYGGIERYYWNDPNYWGGVVSMGPIVAVVELYSNKRRKPILTLFLITAIVFSVITSVVNASRGAILSLAIGGISLVLFSRTSKIIKILSTIGMTALVVFVYNSGMMELLVYRVSNDDSLGEGAGRMAIWQNKINLFMEGGAIHWFFGYGNKGGQNLGGVVAGFHNDYLAFIVEYGIVGFSLFVGWFVSVLKSMRNHKIVVCLLLYFCTLIFSIEPITHGLFSYYAFMFYIYIWSRSSESAHTS